SLNKIFEETASQDLSDIEQLALCLAVDNPEKITKQDLIVYGQILEVLKQHELEKKLLEGWVSKARIIQQNPSSINYLMSLKETVIQKEKNKMEGVERSSSGLEVFHSNSKKRRQEEQSHERTPEPQQANLLGKENDKVLIFSENQGKLMQGTESEERKKSEDKEEARGKKIKKDQEVSQKRTIIEGSTSLDDSVWSLQNRTCDGNTSYKARIIAYKVPGETKDYRINYIKWVLRGSKHIKSVTEEFHSGNNWIVADFDCEHSRKTATECAQKKEGDWCKFVFEEMSAKEEGSFKEESEKVRSQEYKYKQCRALDPQQVEFEKQIAESSSSRNLYKEENDKMEVSRLITIWDLPVDINKKNISYMCRSFKNVNVLRIRKTSFKASAVVEISGRNVVNIPWSLPIGNGKLARVTEGDENVEHRIRQGQYTAKLLEIPRSTSEVLLLRMLKNRGAKSAYIPANRNSNARGYAVITFKSQRDLEAAVSKPFRYYNRTVYWESRVKNGAKKSNRR
ncbi:MAG TPA: RNA-binding protein, partial [Chlamydiales bacterium]|nr:RNA-binding protein [Chlamydiales bacterium]